jgi:isoquinoline 1-oxidoreductase beta subunit
MSLVDKVGRRDFLRLGLGVGAALVLGFRTEAVAATAATAPAAFAPNAFVAIFSDGMVELTVHRSEMGQGIRTTLAMILADELDADWQRVRVVQAPGHPRYGNQYTTGDGSLLYGWEPLRKAAATARAMLLAAAGRELGVPVKELRTQSGDVLHDASGRRRGYGALASRAAAEDVPTAPPLKTSADFRLIGRSMPSVDLMAATSGAVIYGADVRRPGMLHAVVARAPMAKATLKSFDASAAKTIEGFVDAFALVGRFAPYGGTIDGVAVVATDTWTALQARSRLTLEWNEPAKRDDSAALIARLDDALKMPGAIYRSHGDVAHARTTAARTWKREYRAPILAHAPLEPPCCTVEWRDGRCEVWAPTQGPQPVRRQIATEFGVSPENVIVHVTALGGGFGRKSINDFVLEAVRIAAKVKRPVQLLWSREDDLRHGYFRTPAAQQLEAGADIDNAVTFLRHHSAFSSWTPGTSDPAAAELDAGEMSDITAFPYAIPNLAFEGTHVPMPFPCSWMRGVQQQFNAFARNAFIDEIARDLGRDPLELRLQWLGPPRRVEIAQATEGVKVASDEAYWFDTGRLAAVARRARDLSQWTSPLPAGRGRGFALEWMSFTYVAMVAEVTLLDDGFRVDRVVCSVDCGLVINPDGVRAQIEGGVIFGLSSALYGEITLDNGRVVQDNFTSYPIARMADAPEVIADYITSDRTPTGLGEPCVPLVGAAVANAVAAAGGTRLYAMPLYSRARRGVG